MTNPEAAIELDIGALKNHFMKLRVTIIYFMKKIPSIYFYTAD